MQRGTMRCLTCTLLLQLYSVRDIRGDEDGNNVANMSVTEPYTYKTNTSTVYVVLLAATYTGEPPGDNVYTVSGKAKFLN